MRLLSTALAFGVVLFSASIASAMVAPGPIALGFGDQYAEGAATRTHRGMDIQMGEGSSVAAPVSGVVRFAGRIPADGGGTVGAVTLETAEGAVTLLPLSTLSVARGASVGAGDGVGTLAERGDGSSGAAHLHVGLRRGDLYLDPAGLFTAAIAPEPEPEPQPQTVADPEPGSVGGDAPVASGGAGPAVVVGDVTNPGAVDAGVVTQPQPAPSPSAASPRRAGSGVSEPFSQGVSLAPRTQARPASTLGALTARAGALGGAVRALRSAAASPDTVRRAAVGSPAAAGRAMSAQASMPRRTLSAAVLVAGCGSLALAVVASLFLLGVRGIGRFGVDRLMLSDRFGMLLQHMRTGGTLPRLNSCSGLSAFTDPGPPAQRR